MEGAVSSVTCFCKDHNTPQFYPEKMPESVYINPLKTQLNPICHLLALLGAHHILQISRIRVNYTPSPTSDTAKGSLAADATVHPAFKGIVYDKYLAMFNKQFTKHFCCAIWLVGNGRGR
jgi:hypothetical protein